MSLSSVMQACRKDTVALHTTPERMHWKVVGHLRKNKLARIHAWLQKN
jgi:uncharacterized pyridoxal phosphate-containing UPF0001 family protein